MKPTRLTEGPLTSQLLRLAGPVFVSRALHTLYGVAATAWVGRIGPEALAAVSTGFFASWTINAIADLLVAGTTALVAQAIGAHRDDEAARIARTGLVLAAVFGCAVAFLGWTAAPHLFRLLFDDPEIVRLGSTYLSLYALLAPAFFLVYVFESIFRACGNTRTPMLVLGAGSILNLALDPFLILGWGPFPRLEVKGAVLATAISETLVLLAYIVLAFRRRLPLAIHWRAKWDAASTTWAGEIVRIGGPQAVTGILFSSIYLYLSRLTGRFGAAPLAALGVVNRLESLNYLTSVAMGMAVAAMVGQNLGAGRTDRARRAAHRGALLISIVTVLMTVVYMVAAEPIVRIFTPSEEAVRVGAHSLRIVALSQIFMGWEIVYAAAFAGAGHTLPPMIAAVVSSAARVPLAGWWSSLERAGAAGIWWTITVTCIVRGLAITAWFRRGTWEKKGHRFAAAGETQPLGATSEVPDASALPVSATVEEARAEIPSSGEIPPSHTPASREHSPDPRAT